MKQRHRKRRRPVRDLRWRAWTIALLRAVDGRVGMSNWIRPLSDGLCVSFWTVAALLLAAVRMKLVEGSQAMPYLTAQGRDWLRTVDIRTKAARQSRREVAQR